MQIPLADKRFPALTPRLRVLIAATIGILAGLAAYTRTILANNGAADMAWPLNAARDIVAGVNPYIEPWTVDDAGNLWPTNPVMTAMPFLPFTWMPDAIIGATLFGLISALLAYGLTKDQKWCRHY